MLIVVAAILVSLAVGFAAGRVKNAKKLAAFKSHLDTTVKFLESEAAKVDTAVVAKLTAGLKAIHARL